MRGQRLMITAPRQIALHPFELDETGLGETEILVRTRVSLLSGGTEGAWFEGLAMPGRPPTPLPRTTGYASIGDVLVGNLAVQVLETAGMPTTAVDIVPERRALAARHGASQVLDSADAAAPQPRHALVLEASGTARGSPSALALARLGGEVALVGTPWRPDPSGTASAILEAVRLRFITIRGGWEWQLPMFEPVDERGQIHQPGSVQASRRYALALLRTGKVRVADLITHRYEPADCQRAYEAALDRRHEQLGAVFHWPAA